jgi:hypothetical protein
MEAFERRTPDIEKLVRVVKPGLPGEMIRYL